MRHMREDYGVREEALSIEALADMGGQKVVSSLLDRVVRHASKYYIQQ